MVGRLRQEGLFVRPTTTHSVGTCYRCGTVIEPLLSLQWFMDMKRLAEPAISVRGRWPGALRARALGRRVPGLDARHPSVVHQPAAVVGAPAARVVLRRLRQGGRGCRTARGMSRVRRAAASGRGRARYLVQLGALAVRHPGLAATQSRPGLLLSHLRALHRPRHHLPLGGPHGDDGPGVHGRRPLPRCHRAPHDPGRRRPADEQEPRHRGRSRWS